MESIEGIMSEVEGEDTSMYVPPEVVLKDPRASVKVRLYATGSYFTITPQAREPPLRHPCGRQLEADARCTAPFRWRTRAA